MPQSRPRRGLSPHSIDPAEDGAHMTLLVTGGAGFIGSNFVLDWLAQSDEPIVNLDKLTYAGNLDNLASLHGDPRHHFVQGDIGDRALVERLLAEHRPRAVLHFAALTSVPESVEDPARYYAVNLVGTWNVLEAMRTHGAKLFVFSSSAAVYGDPQRIPIPEDHPTRPKSPYGRTKLMVEEILAVASRAPSGTNVQPWRVRVLAPSELSPREAP
ncbi:MAG: GDP-mannose 4,6-dehydratase, partial [Myxococcota bacterium]